MITRGYLCRFAGAALAVVALAGCQSSDDAASSPPSPVRPTQVSTSPTPTASSTAPTASADAWARVPQAARAHTFAGAQAFAEFYLGELNRAWISADPQVIQRFASKDCATCGGLVATAEGMRRRSERYDGDAVRVVATTYMPESTLAKPIVRVVNVQQARAVVNAAGAVVRRVPRRPNEAQFELSWHQDRWLVDAIKDVQVSRK